MSEEKHSEFKETRDGQDWFDFVCEGCGSEGEIGVPHDLEMQPFGCPEGCGATYVRWRPGGGNPDLKCVVRPFRED